MSPSPWLAVPPLLLAIGCAAAPPPKRVGRQDPGEHVRQIGTEWFEQSDDEGVLTGDSRGIASFRVHTEVSVKLLPDERLVESITRTELLRMTTGETFTCTAAGAIPGVARYLWKDDEVRVTLETPEGSIPRSCKPAGFPDSHKDFAPRTRVFALREDRLVGIELRGRRTVLLPR